MVDFYIWFKYNFYLYTTDTVHKDNIYFFSGCSSSSQATESSIVEQPFVSKSIFIWENKSATMLIFKKLNWTNINKLWISVYTVY